MIFIPELAYSTGKVMSQNIAREVIDHLMGIPEPTLRDVNVAKMIVAEKYNLKRVLSNRLYGRSLA